MRHVLSVGLVLALASLIAPSFAEEPPYTEGTVMEMTFVRIKAGGEDDYLKFLATTWKSRVGGRVQEHGCARRYGCEDAPTHREDGRFVGKSQ